MTEAFYGTDSLFVIFLEHPLYEILAFGRHILPNVVRVCDFAFAHGSEYLLVILPIEWRITTQQNVHDDATAPYVALGVIGLSNYFWRYVIRRAYRLVQIFVWVKLQ